MEYLNNTVSSLNTSHTLFNNTQQLLSAIKLGNIAMLDDTFKRNVRVFIPKRCDSQCFLHVAVKANQLGVVQYLLEKYKELEKTDHINHKNSIGDPVLHCAVRENNLEMVRLLVQKGAKIRCPNNNGNIAFHIAATMKYLKICVFLFKLEGWIYFNTEKNHHGFSIYDTMHERMEKKIAQQFLEKSITLQKRFFKFVIIAIQRGNIEIFHQHIFKNPNVLQQTDEFDQTLVHIAIRYRQLEIVKALIGKYGQIWQLSALDYQQNTPIFYAIQSNDIPIVQWFMQNNYGFVFNGANQTPLHVAARYDRFVIAQYLLQMDSYKYQLNAPDDNGDTPLLEAIKSGSKSMVQLLLYYNADVNLSNTALKYPIDVAVGNNDMYSMELLIKQGASFC